MYCVSLRLIHFQDVCSSGFCKVAFWSDCIAKANSNDAMACEQRVWPPDLIINLSSVYETTQEEKSNGAGEDVFSHMPVGRHGRRRGHE